MGDSNLKIVFGALETPDVLHIPPTCQAVRKWCVLAFPMVRFVHSGLSVKSAPEWLGIYDWGFLALTQNDWGFWDFPYGIWDFFAKFFHAFGAKLTMYRYVVVFLRITLRLKYY